MNHTQDLSRIIGELTPFADTDKQTQRQQRRAKTCASLTEAIRRSGLRDGMTISFHSRRRLDAESGDGSAGDNGF